MHKMNTITPTRDLQNMHMVVQLRESYLQSSMRWWADSMSRMLYMIVGSVKESGLYNAT